MADLVAFQPFDLSLQRIEVGAGSTAEEEVDAEFRQGWFRLVGEVQGPDGGGVVVAHLFRRSVEGFAQVLAVAYLKPRVSDERPDPYAPEELEAWARQVGYEVLWDFCRRAVDSLSVQMDFTLSFENFPPDYEWSLRSDVADAEANAPVQA